MRALPPDAEPLLRAVFRGDARAVEIMLLALQLDADDPADVASMQASMAARTGKPPPPAEQVRRTLGATCQVAMVMLLALRGDPYAREDLTLMAREASRYRAQKKKRRGKR